MVVTDPIADMLTRIRNAITVRHDRVAVPASNLKIELARLLKEGGFIVNYDVLKSGTPQAVINIYLHYRDRNIPAIVGLKRVSKPGLRVYVGKGEIPRVYGGLGLAIVSTSKGLMAGRRAWREGMGGELICYVW